MKRRKKRDKAAELAAFSALCNAFCMKNVYSYQEFQVALYENIEDWPGLEEYMISLADIADLNQSFDIQIFIAKYLIEHGYFSAVSQQHDSAEDKDAYSYILSMFGAEEMFHHICIDNLPLEEGDTLIAGDEWSDALMDKLFEAFPNQGKTLPMCVHDVINTSILDPALYLGTYGGRDYYKDDDMMKNYVVSVLKVKLGENIRKDMNSLSLIGDDLPRWREYISHGYQIVGEDVYFILALPEVYGVPEGEKIVNMVDLLMFLNKLRVPDLG